MGVRSAHGFLDADFDEKALASQARDVSRIGYPIGEVQPQETCRGRQLSNIFRELSGDSGLLQNQIRRSTNVPPLQMERHA